MITADRENGLGEFLARNVSGEWSEERLGNQIHYCLEQAEPRSVQMLPIAQALSDYLLEREGVEWLSHILRRRYRDFTSEERDGIMDAAIRELHADPDLERDRNDLATATLMGFLNEHDRVVVSGVWTFLLPEIREAYEASVDQAVDNHLADCEYQQYVNLLKGLVEKTESSVDAVHVLGQDGPFRLEDQDGKPVGEQLMDEMRSGINWDETLEDDLLVSVLFTLAPKTVVLHHLEPEAVTIRTLEAVFGQPVQFCQGCSRCRDGQRFFNR